MVRPPPCGMLLLRQYPIWAVLVWLVLMSLSISEGCGALSSWVVLPCPLTFGMCFFPFLPTSFGGAAVPFFFSINIPKQRCLSHFRPLEIFNKRIRNISPLPPLTTNLPGKDVPIDQEVCAHRVARNGGRRKRWEWVSSPRAARRVDNGLPKESTVGE